MSVVFEKVQVGDKLWDCRWTKAGNTTMRRWSCWEVRVKEVNHILGWAMVSWNGNPVQKVFRGFFRGSNISRSERPEPGSQRRAALSSSQESK